MASKPITWLLKKLFEVLPLIVARSLFYRVGNNNGSLNNGFGSLKDNSGSLDDENNKESGSLKDNLGSLSVSVGRK